MGKSSRVKGRAQKAAARSGSSFVFTVAIGVVVVIGVIALVIIRSGTPASSSIPPRLNDHLHAALGINICDQWQGNPAQFTTKASDPSAYAGIHTHADGLIHMEPQTTEDTGNHATLGRFMSYGGWKLNTTSVQAWDGIDKKNGDKCGNTPGTLRWGVNGIERHGNPASWKLHNLDVIAIAFIPAAEKFDFSAVPSKANFANPNAKEPGNTTPTTPATVPNSGPTSPSQSSSP